MCGLYYIQEPSAMSVAACLDIKENDYVLDMCGAPGGKTCYVASRLSNEGLMIANDISKLRASILSSNIERFGLKNTIVTNCDPLKMKFESFFDKIILDAPCSGEGMFRKDKEAIDTWSMQKINECAYIQRNLIDQAYKMLKKDGILIYSTCTYSLDENEKQVEYMINELGMKLLPINKKEGMSDGFIEGTIRMYPHINRGEGQFIAMLQKTTERFEPSLSLALTLNKEDVKRSYNFKCDSQEVKDYLSGLTLKGNNQKGYGVIFVDGYPLSFYKESNNQVKNLYPKGLRR